MHSAKKKMFKCVKCGAVVEAVMPCDCASCGVVCCGDAMAEVIANTVDAAKEKHVPVVTGDERGVKVTVGSVAHPMTAEHYIVWIEVFNGAWLNRKYLRPGEAPTAEFFVPYKRGLVVRAYCNLHGLWETTVE